MTFVIDCFGGGLRGLDLELIQCMIGAFKESYPSMLNYIFVLEMPWVLNGKNLQPIGNHAHESKVFGDGCPFPLQLLGN